MFYPAILVFIWSRILSASILGIDILRHYPGQYRIKMSETTSKKKAESSRHGGRYLMRWEGLKYAASQKSQRLCTAMTLESLGSKDLEKVRISRLTLVNGIDSDDKKLLLAIQSVCNQQGKKLDWDAIAKEVDPQITGGAAVQHLAKLRQRMVAEGFDVPPPLKRGGTATIRGNLSGGGYQKRSGHEAEQTPSIKRGGIRKSAPKQGHKRGPKSRARSSSASSDESEDTSETMDSDEDYPKRKHKGKKAPPTRPTRKAKKRRTTFKEDSNEENDESYDGNNEEQSGNMGNDEDEEAVEHSKSDSDTSFKGTPASESLSPSKMVVLKIRKGSEQYPAGLLHFPAGENGKDNEMKVEDENPVSRNTLFNSNLPQHAHHQIDYSNSTNGIHPAAMYANTSDGSFGSLTQPSPGFLPMHAYHAYPNTLNANIPMVSPLGVLDSLGLNAEVNGLPSMPSDPTFPSLFSAASDLHLDAYNFGYEDELDFE
ncbi:MAG: hypothetical protein M1834_005765 [Cirrosporium novae-zelandiae]|nr:MAG: hypothetical protein M1834_005765 [Cirrosporium novae-zelandiae]